MIFFNLIGIFFSLFALYFSSTKLERVFFAFLVILNTSFFCINIFKFL